MFTYEHKVQYYETDKMNVVHHSNYIRWFEEARTDTLEKIGLGDNTLEELGLITPIISVKSKYKSMSKFGETENCFVSTSGKPLNLKKHFKDIDKIFAECIPS